MTLHVFRDIVRTSIAVTVFIALCMHSSNVAARTYYVGTGSGCSHATLQQAIDAASAAGADRIQVSKGAADTAQRLQITGQDLTIVGGYENCQDTSDPGFEQTLVSGLGRGASVFTIRGPGVVVLSNLQITDGNSSNDGGGIDYLGSSTNGSSNSLTLREVSIALNQSVFHGGGIAFRGGGSQPAYLDLDEGSGFFDNLTQGDGGALYLAGNAHLLAQSERLFFHRNQAIRGGALFVAQPAQAEIGSAKWDSFETFIDNAAFQGGAITVIAPDPALPESMVKLYSIVADRPLLFTRNTARSSGPVGTGVGGAFYVVGADRAGTFTASICARRIGAEANQADDGALAFLRSARFGYCPGVQFAPLAVTACSPASACGNYAKNIASDRDASAVLVADSGSSVELRDIRFNENTFAGSLIRIGDSPLRFGFLVVRNSEIGANVRSPSSAQGFLFEPFPGSTIEIANSTIAHNRDTGGAGISGVFGQFVGYSALQQARYSIIHQPSTPLVWVEDAQIPQIMLDRVLLAQREDWMPANDAIKVGDPKFVSATDRHLTVASPAVDAAFNQGDANFDLDLLPRSVDIEDVSHGDGPTDLGAFELQLDPDAIFADDFE